MGEPQDGCSEKRWRGCRAGGFNPALTANFSFQLNGISDADLARRVMTALESSKGDVERLLSEIVHNQMRVSYAG